MPHPLLDNTLKLGIILQFILNKQLKRRPKQLSERRCNCHFYYELHASQRKETQDKATHVLGTKHGWGVERGVIGTEYRNVHVYGLGRIERTI